MSGNKHLLHADVACVLLAGFLCSWLMVLEQANPKGELQGTNLLHFHQLILGDPWGPLQSIIWSFCAQVFKPLYLSFLEDQEEEVENI